MITKNKNVIFLLYPATFVPLFAAGAFYSKGDFSNAMFVLYALVPLMLSVFISAAAFAMRGTKRVAEFVEKFSLVRFGVFAFATFAACVAAATAILPAIFGRDGLSMAFAAWIVGMSIFTVYLFCYLYAVHFILYKDNPDFE